MKTTAKTLRGEDDTVDVYDFDAQITSATIQTTEKEEEEEEEETAKIAARGTKTKKKKSIITTTARIATVILVHLNSKNIMKMEIMMFN